MQPPPDHGEDSGRGATRLAGLKALITGADSGIGRAVAIACARKGADVALVHLDDTEDARSTADLARQAGRAGAAPFAAPFVCVLPPGPFHPGCFTASVSPRLFHTGYFTVIVITSEKTGGSCGM